MELDLVAQERHAGRERLRKERGVEVADADEADTPGPALGIHSVKRLGERHLRIGPVNEKEVDLLDAEPVEALVERRRDHLRPQPVRPDLGGDEDVPARNSGIAEAFPDRRLVAIALGRVDVAIARLDRLCNQAATLGALERPGSEPDRRHGSEQRGGHCASSVSAALRERSTLTSASLLCK